MAESFAPFFLDRLTDTTRLLNAQAVQYTNMIVAAYLTKVCEKKVS